MLLERQVKLISYTGALAYPCMFMLNTFTIFYNFKGAWIRSVYD